MQNFGQPLEARKTDIVIKMLPRGVPDEPQCLSDCDPKKVAPQSQNNKR